MNGDCYHYARSRSFFWGFTIHLWTVLPAGLLAVLQFVPAIRRRAPAVHRALGYTCLALCVPGIASALPLLARSQGGDLSVRTGVAALGACSSYALVRAWRAIAREGRVDAHRAWMLRAWSYLGCIVTMRPLIIGSAWALQYLAPLPVTMPCEQLRFVLAADGASNASGLVQERLVALHPVCADAGAMAVVQGDWFSKAISEGRPDRAVAAGHVLFGASIWVSLALHAVAVEWYLASTQGENDKLKAVSKKYQAKLGLKPEPEKKELKSS